MNASPASSLARAARLRSQLMPLGRAFVAMCCAYPYPLQSTVCHTRQLLTTLETSRRFCRVRQLRTPHSHTFDHARSPSVAGASRSPATHRYALPRPRARHASASCSRPRTLLGILLYSVSLALRLLTRDPSTCSAAPACLGNRLRRCSAPWCSLPSAAAMTRPAQQGWQRAARASSRRVAVRRAR